MNEIRRFLRFVLPGIAVVVQLSIATAATHAVEAGAYLQEKDLVANVALVITAFLASGGLGYIFGILYFALYWSWPLSNIIAIDHRGLFVSMTEVTIVSPSGAQIHAASLSKRDAWVLLTTFWNTRMERIDLLRALGGTVDRLVDVTHSLGTTITGSLFAFALWFFLSCGHVPATRVIAVGIPWLAVVSLMALNYRHTRSSLQSMVNSAFAEAIAAERGEASTITLVLSPTDATPAEPGAV